MSDDELHKMLDIAFKMKDTNAEIMYISPDKLIYLINRIRELEVLAQEKLRQLEHSIE